MRRAAGATLLIGLAAARAVAAEPSYAPEPVGTELAAGERIGRVRAGLLCLPQAGLRWRDLGIAQRVDQRGIIAEALEGEGLAVAAVSREAPDRRIVRGTVTAARFDVCAPRGTFRADSAVAGTAGLDVAWRVGAGGDGGADLAHVSHVALDLSRADARPLPALYRALLAGAARDLAAWLTHGGAGPDRAAR